MLLYYFFNEINITLIKCISCLGAYYIQQGLIKGAEKAGDLMNYGAPKIMNHVRPAHEPKPIPTKVQKGFAIAQDVTHTAANVTGFVGKCSYFSVTD